MNGYKTAAGKPVIILGAGTAYVKNAGAVNLNGNYSGGGEIDASLDFSDCVVISTVEYVLSWTNAAALSLTQFAAGAALTDGVGLSITQNGCATNVSASLGALKTNGELPGAVISESGTRKTIVGTINLPSPLVLNANAGDAFAVSLSDNLTGADYFSVRVTGLYGQTV